MDKPLSEIHRIATAGRISEALPKRDRRSRDGRQFQEDLTNEESGGNAPRASPGQAPAKAPIRPSPPAGSHNGEKVLDYEA